MSKSSNETLKTSQLILHFVSDKDVTNNVGGFKIRYRLTCGTTKYLRRSDDVHEITSPNYPTSLNEPQECDWFLISGSGRNLTAQVIDLDTIEDTPCSPDNSLAIYSNYHELISRHCGRLNDKTITYTSNSSNLRIIYTSEASHRKGFKILVTEQMTKCPGETIRLTVDYPSRWIYSPEHPARIPISTECDYVISAPHDHRIMITFDAHQFNLMNEKNEHTDLDYIELRDGPSEHSQLIGKYQGGEAPPTQFSTTNFMFMRLSTDSKYKIGGFAAKFEIAKCGGSKMIYRQDEIHYISAPVIEQRDLNCRWVVRSQNTHFLEFRFEVLKIDHGRKCKKHQLLIHDGNQNSSTFFNEDECTKPETNLEWRISSSSEITIDYNFTYDYKSSATSNLFKIAVKLSYRTCGGEISNRDGHILSPQLKNIKCVWNIQAKPGFTYRFFSMISAEDFYYAYDAKRNTTCYPDFSVVEETGNNQRLQFVKQTFCASKMDILMWTSKCQLIYDDTPSRESRRSLNTFKISYHEIPIPKDHCSYIVTTAQTINFGSKIPNLCSISIQKPPKYRKYRTVRIKINNFGREESLYPCELSSFTLKSDGEPSFEYNYCSTSIRNKMMEFVHTNDNIDLLIFEDPEVKKRNKNVSLEIDFFGCGGVITDSKSFGNISQPESNRCRWDFVAPPGQIIKIKILSMNIRPSSGCSLDSLTIREGRQDTQGLLHRYCENMSDSSKLFQLDDEFKVIKSKSRFLNMEWIRRASIGMSDWTIEYTFIDEDGECGFHSSASSGIMTTPRFSEQDYPNNVMCIWDINVPSGHHINLIYDEFNVEKSDNCTKDALQISDVYQDSFTEDKIVSHPAICGYQTPKDIFSSGSRRLRLNFTSDDRVTARGFRIRWEAECGATLTKYHDIITAPNYPQGYSHSPEACEYVIKANDTDTVVVRFIDIDLPNQSRGGDQCWVDHLEIVKVPSNEVLLTICGKEEMPEEPLTFKGSIAIILKKRMSFNMNEKPYRGFKASYQKYECGRNVHLDDDHLSQSILSPAFPLLRQHELNCIWNITTSNKYRLSYQYLNFDLDKNRNCSADYIEISDAAGLLQKDCGDQDDVSYQIVGTNVSKIQVRMVSDGHNNGVGFRMYVRASLGSEGGCGGVLNADETWKVLEPPRDADGKYLNNLHCVWHITTNNNDKAIQLRIDHIDIEKIYRLNCIRDHLKILDGPSQTSTPLLDAVCGNMSLSKTLNSSSSRVTVVFSSGYSGTGNGFKLYYTLSNTSSCETSHVVRDDPQSYEFKIETSSHERRCKLYLQGELDKHFEIKFDQIDFKTCAEGSIEIEDIGQVIAQRHNDRRVIRLCGNKTIPSFVASSDVVLIHIITRNFTTSGIVKFTYQNLNKCNETIDTNVHGSGRLTSPGFPGYFNGEKGCTNTIKSSKKTMLVFKTHPENGTELRSQGSVHSLTQTYFSDEKELNITIKSSKNDKVKGYDATYFTVADELDDGTIIFADNYETEGILTNIGYPNDYANWTTQIFTLRPPSQTPCLISLETINIGLRSDCKTPKGTELLLIQYKNYNFKYDECQRAVSSELPIGEGDEHRFIKLTFKSDDDSSNNGRGVKVTWKCDVRLKYGRKSNSFWL